MKMLFAIVICASLVILSVRPTRAQTTRLSTDPTGLQLSRSELETLLSQYEQTAASDAYSRQLRERARTDAELIRSRLEEGDLRIGDRISLVVEGQTQLSDTFNVVAGRVIVLPEIGSIALLGVLRSELQPHLTAEIGRYIRDPVVHARSLIRVGIMGAVARPGFYTIPSDVLISDAFMIAGGPQAAAELDKARIDRGDETIWDANLLREAVIEGRTLDQLSVRAGDEIFIPQKGNRLTSLRNGMVIVSGLTSLVLIAKQLGAF
jgi:protein involved in polysaccharide export with SLBB domain